MRYDSWKPRKQQQGKLWQQRSKVKRVSSFDITSAIVLSNSRPEQGWMDWLGVSSVAEKAAGNVQASIKNIHIRYEDDTSMPGVSGGKRKPVVGTLTLSYSPASFRSRCYFVKL